MPRLHAVFSSGFPPKKKRAAGDGNPSILVYFSKKAQPLPHEASEHKMYLSFCLYRLERLRVNTNPKN